MATVIAHLHNGIRYSLYDNYGATRCEWHSCTHNVYDSFDTPEREITADDTNDDEE